MSLWKIIRDHVREFENINRIELGDQSWQVFKRMEEVILAYYREGECADLRAEVDRLRAENAELRAMLKGLVDDEYSILDFNAEDEWWTCDFCGNIVRRYFARES